MGIQEKGTSQKEESASFNEIEFKIKQLPSKRSQTGIQRNYKLKNYKTTGK
jgi:hypothetical protein